jgi:ABC-type dipeptide/oligopeptide/nickel transport system permease subunit
MSQAPWLAIWPAVALSLAVFGFNMLGDACETSSTRA